MDCQRVAELLRLRPDEPAQRAALADHLAQCGSCAAEAEREQRLDQVLRSALVAEAPPELSERLTALGRSHSRLKVGGLRLDRVSRNSNLKPQTSNVRPMRREERVAAYLLAAVAAIALGATVGPGQWLVLLSLGGEVFVAAQVVLSSPTVWLLPEASELVGWFVPGLALLVLAWLLRPAEARPRPQRARRARS